MTVDRKGMEKEIEALRKAARDRERDLDTLNTVLQCNQDIISVRTHTLGDQGWSKTRPPPDAVYICTLSAAHFTPQRCI